MDTYPIAQYEQFLYQSDCLRRGYTIAAAWDEGAMIQAMARMDNPTLRWRYGDMNEDARDGTGEPTARGDG